MTIRDDDLIKLQKYANIMDKVSYIDPALYEKYDVKRGLRNQNGTGVLVGITRIADVTGYEYRDGKKIPIEGDLSYRGYSIKDLINTGDMSGNIFEEICYLLLFNELPNKESLKNFCDILADMRSLPEHYLEDVILKLPSDDIVNAMQRAVLALYTYDDNPTSTDTFNVMKQSLELIARLPVIMAYSYMTKKHYLDNDSLVIHSPKNEYKTAENILHLIRNDSSFTTDEAELLDLMLVLHAEHGGGNNSAFTTHVVSSTGTDTYSVITAALGSLKGPRHGGASIMVTNMIEDMNINLGYKKDEGSIRNYLIKILNREAFDKKGLIYGIGHAVYTISDPRAKILKDKSKKLAMEKGFEEEFKYLQTIERIAGELMMEKNNLSYPLTANIDFYSGFIYKMLNIPKELFIPIFAVSRITGWLAHRIEQLLDTKIVRPAYVTLNKSRKYIRMDERK